MNRAKSAAAAAVLLVLLGAGGLLRAQDAPSGKIDMKFSGGLAWLAGGDINEALESFSAYWAARAAAEGYVVKGAFAPARLGPELGLDIIFRLSPTWGIGFGAGYVGAARETSMTFESPDRTLVQIVRPSISAAPIRVGVFKAIPLSRSLSVVLNAGVGYYFAQGRALWNLGEEGGDSALLDVHTEKGGGGVHGGVGLAFKAGPAVSLLLEASGRWARLSGFTGTGSNVMNGESVTAAGTLYYFEPLNAAGTGREYAMVFVFAVPPAGDVTYREARVDFGGISIRAGLVFHL